MTQHNKYTVRTITRFLLKKGFTMEPRNPGMDIIRGYKVIRFNLDNKTAYLHPNGTFTIIDWNHYYIHK